MPNATRIKKTTRELEPKILETHSKAYVFSFMQLMRSPVTNLITIIIIALALALPTGLYVLLKNIHTVNSIWSKGTQISLYLRANVTTKKSQELMEKIKKNYDIATIKYISPDEGLAEFEKTSGFGDILATLKKNPLPAVILVEPKLSLQTETIMTKLAAAFKSMPEVASVYLDSDWTERLGIFVSLGNRFLSALFVFLCVSLILIISNIISLTTHLALHKVTSKKDYSGDNSFVYRVFLYKGIWFGTFGSILAWLFVGGFLWWLQVPIAKLAATYNSSFVLKNLSWQAGLILIVIGISLGLCGAWLGIIRHRSTAIKDFERHQEAA